MLVSVIVPVYNVSPYLREALDSVINQTYNELEIIIVDDGSTDGSCAICEEYAASDTRIKLIHQENRGLSGARNTGLECATGDFVAFVDSDDSISPAFIETLVNELSSASASIAICRFSIRCASGSMKGIAASSIIPVIEAGIYERPEALKLLVDEKLNVNVCNKLFKRELWSDVRFAEGHYYEDAVPEFMLFDKADRVVLVDEALYNYRRRTDSITASVSLAKINDCISAHFQISEFIRTKLSDIIPDSQYLKKHQSILSFLIISYIKLAKSCSKDKALKRELRTLIIKYKRELGMNTLEPKAKLYYRIIRFCPFLLGILRNRH